MPIALLTDFGTGSIYAGQVKGAIAARAPGAVAIDLCHEVEPQAVDEAAFLLASAFPHFPPGTIFLAVVDPGVGSAREIAILEAAGRTFVAPDNGLLGLVVARLSGEGRAFHVGPALYAGASATFHGRDIMAPVAARLALGEAPAALGRPVAVHDLVRYPASLPHAITARRWRARIVHIDRFGNLVSDLVPAPGLALRAARVGGHEVARAGRTYADVEPGMLFVYVGSFGTVEVAARQGSAARTLGVRRGADLEVEFDSRATAEGRE